MCDGDVVTIMHNIMHSITLALAVVLQICNIKYITPTRVLFRIFCLGEKIRVGIDGGQDPRGAGGIPPPPSPRKKLNFEPSKSDSEAF